MGENQLIITPISNDSVSGYDQKKNRRNSFVFSSNQIEKKNLKIYSVTPNKYPNFTGK